MTMATSTAAIISGWTERSGCRATPIQSANPDAPIPAASARPPPNIMITPQGARFASSQLRMARPVPSGMTNRSSAAITAIVPSVSESLGRKGVTNGIAIQAATVSATSGTRRFSAVDQGPVSPIPARAAAGSKSVAETFCTFINIAQHSGTETRTSGIP
jgi:hypothetical protein